MRIYRNEKTGAILNTECVINGGAWVEITEAPKAEKPAPEEVPEEITEDVPAPKKPGRKKKG